MILHLRASTTAAGYAIFDPAAIPRFIGADVEEMFETILVQNELGNLILYSDSDDGQTLLRVYIDEDPGDELMLRASHVARGGFCRFPSGRICFMGAEEVQLFQEQPASNAGAELPSGQYAAEGFDVDWAPAELGDALRDRVGKWAYIFRGMLYILAASGCLGAMTSGILFVVAALAGYAEVAALVMICFMAVIVGSFMLRRLPMVKRVNAAEQNLQLQFPPVVLVLHRLPDDADTSSLHGLAFGAGHMRREKSRAFEVIFPPQHDAQSGA
jgi:hypothetical protein